MLKKKYLFIDRDGTIVLEPHDYQVDALNKIAFVPKVIPALLQLKEAGYHFVMVTNQDGLGTPSLPLADFTESHEFILNVLSSQGIEFEQVLICPHKSEDNCECRKPKLGMMQGYLKDESWDRAYSFFIGDRDTDLQMAKNMGITGIRVGKKITNLSEADSNIIAKDSPFADILPIEWDTIAQKLCAKAKEQELSSVGNNTNENTLASSIPLKAHRTATVERNTKETQIKITVDLDQVGQSKINTGLGFFDHMLDQIATHASFSLEATVHGDLEIDGHHTIEDTAIALGTALKQALRDKRGIGRFGFVVAMDEVCAKVMGTSNQALLALDDCSRPCELNLQEQQEMQGASVSLDISGRPHVEFQLDAEFTRADINGFETQMVAHFFESLAINMGLTLHMSVTSGNAHHQVEALFKAFGRALRPALKVQGQELPSSKGTL